MQWSHQPRTFAMGALLGIWVLDILVIAWHSEHSTIVDGCRQTNHEGIVELDANTWVHLDLEELARVRKDSHI